jgi:host factor-I protein
MQNSGVKKAQAAKPAGKHAAAPAQVRFLTEMVRERRLVAIFLINGLKLEGRIASFDDYVLLLEGDMADHVYKHAISTIQPLAGAGAAVEADAKTGQPAVIAHFAAAAEERKPRQPTVVVRPKRRVVKRDAD